DRADRRGFGPRILLRADPTSRATQRTRIAGCAGTAGRGRAVVLPQRGSVLVLPVQTRVGTGCRLRHVAARTAAGTTRPCRDGAGAAIRRSRRAPARTFGASPDRRRRYRTRGRSMAEGRPA